MKRNFLELKEVIESVWIKDFRELALRLKGHIINHEAVNKIKDSNILLQYS
jgi:hypothetical protein